MNKPVEGSVAASPVKVDPVTLEILRTSLQSIPDLIELDLTRTAFSPLIYEFKDYAVGLVDDQGRSIALARNGLPGFLANPLGLAVRDGLKFYGRDGIEPGDVLLTNHAGTLGQHLNNVVMYTPIFTPGGKLVAFMAVNVHWVDIGGKYPGSMGTDVTELAQEGLQLRSVKLHSRGKRIEDMYRVIQYNTRQPDLLMGDIAAQLAGCMKGKAMFEQLMARHGDAKLFAAVHEIWRGSALASRAAVRKVPDGVYEASSFMDDDGVDRGKPLPVHVKVHISDGNFIVDYSDCGAQVKGPFNSVYHGGGEVCARVAFKYLFSPVEPANEGGFEPVSIILPPGKFLSASENAPMGYYQTPLSTVIDTIIAAMAPALPDRVAAGHHASFGATAFRGQNPRSGRFFYYTDNAHGGWGASAHGDGVGPYKTIRHADNRDIPVETAEALYPLVVERYEWRTDSAGAGRHRGGLGLNKTFRVLAPCKFQTAFERFACPPWGLFGGLHGDPGYCEYENGKGERETIHKVANLSMEPGDRLHVHTGAGGGYGPPAERDPEKVRVDVLRGYVSRKQAEEVYAVVIAADGKIDAGATAQRRKALLAAAG
jgi:N-methylhydantoinase B